MQLKLAKKKEINEDVLRMIIQYGLGFASRVKNLENKEIEDWKEDKLYEKGAKVLYNNYLWVAKVTNQSSTWNESYWEKIGDNLELIDLDTIKTMLGLTTDELQTLSSIILDSQVRLDKTWSSSKIYTDLQQCLNDSKTFTLQEFAKASKASYHVVSATSEMTDKSVIYLMPNSTNYDMYIVESDGTPTKIGDTTIDLSQFYTKTEIDNDFVKKTDADGKYATITTVDGKVDKTSILSTISSTPSDDKLLSEKAIKSELDTINTNLDDKIDKASITTPIDKTSTDTQVPSAKVVYDNIINKLNNTITLTTADEVNSFDRSYQSFVINATVATEVGLMDSSWPASSWFCIHFSHSKIYKYPSQIAFEYAGFNRIMYRTSNNGKWRTWQRLCATSVKDVPKTNIAPADETKFIGFKGNSMCNYCVVNGVCYVSLWNVKVSVTGRTVTGVILPMPKTGFFGGACLIGGGDADTHAYAHIIPETGELKINVKDANTALYGAFSYPVSES